MNGLDISNTPLVNEWLQQGEAKGKIEGRIEGKLEGKIETLLDLGTSLLGEPSAKIKKAIRGTKDIEQLSSMLHRVLRAKSWQEVLNG